MRSNTLDGVALADLDEAVSEAERAAGPIRPGAAKRIVWQDPTRRPTPVSLVYIHGFSASRREIAPVCDRMARRLGANLFYTRLTGHGQDGHAMARCATDDWMADTFQAVGVGRRLGRRVVLFGTSTGGTLAVWAAAQPELAPDIAALVLMSPNFGPCHPLAGLLQFSRAQRPARRLLSGGWRSMARQNPGHAEVWTLDYPWTAVLPMLRLVGRVGGIDPAGLHLPVLLFYHANDRVVRVRRMRRFYRRLGSVRRRRFRVECTAHPGRHILAGDVFAPEMTLPVADCAVTFLRETIGA